MSNRVRQQDVALSAPGHLTVPIAGSGADVPFLFERQDQRMGGALGASVVAHIVGGALFLLLASLRPEPAPQAVLPERLPEEIVWLAEPGPGGGGGGGGNEMPEPPRVAELPGKDPITVPVVEPEPAPVVAEQVPEPEPALSFNIPAMTMAAAMTTSPGVLESNAASNSVAQGSGTGGGAGTGSGTGIGPGQGSGLGPGFGGGTGGGAYQPGNGVTTPRLLRKVDPQYTADAMRAKVQGVVVLKCIVMPDGTVGDVMVTRSLDKNFGLDEEAIKAARQWRFAPGTRFGEPVPVVVNIELSFTVR
ncbi:MAG: TonB family protein [Acidimicrobiia bacterium]|nr:TonB family protein [Acidimicrobiia bacterium]